MKMINIAEFKTHASKYLAAVERGEEVLIAKRNVPIARIVPNGRPAHRNRPKPGLMAGTVRIRGDIVSPAIDLSEWDVMKS
ncbi:MAG: hypothetical protein A3G34_16540 [Candidatus Lindowbacteria bacterium RIFCSPLOWO2_12_FULL_62_27]|nr:MAG: hypothetical protein A3G34_16540 [Candidatus Lindowbacteria bacterium RIFCSPLOWO2_12_FULL_62_27]